MSKEEAIQMFGKIVEILPDSNFRIELDNGKVVIAYSSGRIRKNKIKIVLGDNVTVEFTPYDLDRGRLVFRR